MMKYVPYHLVEMSPWPIMCSVSFFTFGIGVVIMVSFYNFYFFMISVFLLMFSGYLWGRDVHREGCYTGCHNMEVVDGFKIGMVLFIFSECFFFGGMFWSYFHLAQVPSMEMGSVWPAVGIVGLDPKGVPFLNTIILLSSGVTVTVCHYYMFYGSFFMVFNFLILTIALGVIFTFFQFLEYFVCGFTFSCSSYSSVFFMGTGFHGLHVIVGSILLLFVGLLRFFHFHNSSFYSSGFECSIWYWHFVDVVWFFLYLVFYWWGC